VESPSDCGMDPADDCELGADTESAADDALVTDAETDPIDDEMAPDADAPPESTEADGKPTDEGDLSF